MQLCVDTSHPLHPSFGLQICPHHADPRNRPVHLVFCLVLFRAPPRRVLAVNAITFRFESPGFVIARSAAAAWTAAAAKTDAFGAPRVPAALCIHSHAFLRMQRPVAAPAHTPRSRRLPCQALDRESKCHPHKPQQRVRPCAPVFSSGAAGSSTFSLIRPCPRRPLRGPARSQAGRGAALRPRSGCCRPLRGMGWLDCRRARILPL